MAWEVVEGVVGLGGDVLDFGWKVGTGALDVVWGAGDFVVNDLAGVVEGWKPIVEVLGQGYGLYQSYEQQKAAQKASQRYGGQVVVPYPVATAPGQPAPGGFQTIGDILSPPGQGPAMAKPPGAMDTEKLMLYAGVGLGVYLLFLE